MFYVAGGNLYGQWFSNEMVIEGFELITKKCSKYNFDLDKAKLVQANWTYNIYDIDGVLYISGLWKTEANQLITLPFPVDFPQDCITKIVSGNDKKMIFIDAEKQLIFIMDLSEEAKLKKVNLATEESAHTQHNENTNQIIKVRVTNNACIYMSYANRAMNVYVGMIPTYPEIDYMMDRVVDVQCGYEHYMLLTDSGKVYTWGNGSRHQLGHRGTANLTKPREVLALAGYNIKKIRAGGWHSAVVTEFGNVYMWGWNDVGQLGIKSRTMRRMELQEGPPPERQEMFPVPTVVDIYDSDLNIVPLEVIDVGCGTKHTVILLSDYSVWASGSNEYGQLGLPIADYYSIGHYIKVHQGTSDSVLRCGPWTTVIEN